MASELIPILSFVQPFVASNYIDDVVELIDVNRIDFKKIIEENSGIEINKDLRKVLNSFSENDIGNKDNVQLPIIHITSPQVIELDDGLRTIGAFEDRILFHCKFGDFDEAFKLFQNEFCNNSSNSLTVFMRVLIIPAIEFKQWNVFWRKFNRFLGVIKKRC